MIQSFEVDVVIVNYNSGFALKKCLDSFGHSDQIQINIVVVDNFSDDSSMDEVIQSNSSPLRLTVLNNKQNLGFAKACNQGARLGTSPFITFINPDCFINSQQLKQLVVGLSKEAEAGLIGCRVLNKDRSLQAASRRRLPTLFRVFNHLTGLSKLRFFKGINIKGDGRFDDVETVEAVNGSCYVVKRTVFDAINGFDEAYPLHFEDLDLFSRIKTHGKSLLYDSSVEVIHWQAHSKQQAEQVNLWKKQGLLRYMKKHRPHWEYQISRLFLDPK